VESFEIVGYLAAVVENIVGKKGVMLTLDFGVTFLFIRLLWALYCPGKRIYRLCNISRNAENGSRKCAGTLQCLESGHRFPRIYCRLFSINQKRSQFNVRFVVDRCFRVAHISTLPSEGAKYCDVCGCISVCLYIPTTVGPNFLNFLQVLTTVCITLQVTLLPNPNALAAVSKGMRAVKLCTNKILQFLTGGAGWRRLTCILAI